MSGERHIFNVAEESLRRPWLSPLGITMAPINRAERRLVQELMVYRKERLWRENKRVMQPSEIATPLLEKRSAPEYYQTIYAEMLYEMMKQGYDPRELFVGSPKGVNILDFGCGNGQRTARLVGDNDVWGVDISSKLVAEAQSKGITANVINADDQDLPYDKGTFDLVYSFDVFEHLFNPEHALDQLRKVMKSKGVLIVTVPVLKQSTMQNNVAFHKQILKAIGKTDSPLANIEPEIGVRSFIDWVKFFSRHGFRPITRALGYSWDKKISIEEKIDLFMNPSKAGDICLVLSPINWLQGNNDQFDVEVAAGALSSHEFLSGLRIFPSEQAAALSLMSNPANTTY